MLAVAVYIMIWQPVVPSSFAGQLVGGHGVYIWRCILCRSCSRQLGVPVSSASRWIGARPRRIRAPIDSADLYHGSKDGR